MKKFMVASVLFSTLAGCHHNAPEPYPQIIVDNHLEALYDEAKWEIYKLNTVGYSPVIDFVIEYDTIVENRLYGRGNVDSSEILTKEIREDYEKLSKAFPGRVKYFVECELELFQHENFLLMKGDTVDMLFSIPFQNNFRQMVKLSGRTVYSFEILDGKIITIGEGRRFWPNQGNYIAGLESAFLTYLSTKEKILTPWLRREYRKRKAQMEPN